MFLTIRLGISACYVRRLKEFTRKTHNRTNGKSKSTKRKFPEAPTTPCCMTGCANCVWLQYAEELTEYFKDGGENAKKEIEKQVTDPNMKAYLLHELRMRKS